MENVGKLVGLDLVYEEIKKFQIAFNHPISESPKCLDLKRANIRADWMLEEIDEFMDASFDGNIIEQADAMIDLLYFAIGTLVEMGVKPQKLFEIVQEANMSKLWEDGKPRYYEDGKVKKPTNWINPASLLEEEIKKQMHVVKQ